jgi:hypothetical protein
MIALWAAAKGRHVGCNGAMAMRARSTRSLEKLGVGSTLLILLAGCHRTEPEPVMRPASSTVVANDAAIEKMANANCARELACKNVGHGRRYQTSDLCLSTFKREKYDELGECLLGIDYVQLDLCVREIESEGCGSALYTLETLGACSSDRLCRD